MVNHCGIFVKQLSTKLRHLHNLLCSDVQWHLGKQQSDAFSNNRTIVSSPPIVVHFDPSKPLVLLQTLQSMVSEQCSHIPQLT